MLSFPLRACLLLLSGEDGAQVIYRFDFSFFFLVMNF